MTQSLTAPLLSARLVKVSPPPQHLVDEARAEAERTVAAAKERAEALVAEARAEAERVKSASMVEAKGLIERAIAEEITKARAAFAAELTAVRPVLARLLREGLFKIIARDCGEDVLVVQIEAILAEVGEAAALQLYVSEHDLSRVLEWHAGQTAHVLRPGLTISPDPALAAGQARLVAGAVATQIDLAAQLALFEGLIAGHSDDRGDA